MQQGPNEFTLDPLPVEPYVKRLDAKMRWWHAVTSHVLALVLIVVLSVSIFFHLVFLCRYPEQQDSIAAAFDKWYSVVSPFAGLALGAYYGTARSVRGDKGPV
jgi:ABC-type dipeptide/oligopeptide/nickel transport system permease component